MNRLSALLAALLVVGIFSARAQSPEDQYVRIYNLIQQADALNGNGQSTQALPKYLEAQSALLRIQKLRPDWNPKVVNFRLNYLAEKIDAVATAKPAAPPPTATPTPPAQTPPQAEGQPQSSSTPPAELQSEIARLQTEKAILEAKLKEALATQPAAIDARELTKAQEKIQSLLKENELLKASLESEKGRPESASTKAEMDELKGALAEANRKLAELASSAEASTLEKTALQDRVKQLMASTTDAETLRAENTILKQQLALAKTAAATAATDANQRTAEAEARAAALQSDMQVLKLEKQALETRLKSPTAEATPNTAASQPASSSKELTAKVDHLTKEVTGLQARVEVFEARAIPYTAEELALFQTTKPKTAAAEPTPRRTASRALPTGSAALAAEAQRNFAAKDYAKAEQNYLDILRQDDKNPTALANLATIQMEAGRLDAAERSIRQALAAEPEDGYSLATLGKVKYQQEKYDEALDALSRAAKLIPQNAEIQNYLGVTLSQKGLRGPAETALRKAIQIDPNYGSAHNNLAVIYATHNPPYIELARWHYQKALAAGHPKNEDLEKLFDKKESPAK